MQLIFAYLKTQEFPPLSDKLNGWKIAHHRELLPKERRIGSAITELCSQKKCSLKMCDWDIPIEQSPNKLIDLLF